MLKLAQMAESAPHRGSGSKRKRSGRGKPSRAINSAAWRIDESSSWHCISDFLDTFGVHLPVNSSAFKEFLRNAVTQQTKADSVEDRSPDHYAEGGPLSSQELKVQDMQKALDSIPDSMVQQCIVFRYILVRVSKRYEFVCFALVLVGLAVLSSSSH